jgi:hypothetical protein
MEVTRENILKWFENYFQTFNKNAGPMATVPNMQKFFTPDLEWWSFSMPGSDKPQTRSGLLMSMVHPGLHEHLTPRYFVVDLSTLVVVVQFQLQFTDEPSKTTWPARQASAHYHLVKDDKVGFKIKKIEYWTGSAEPADVPAYTNMRQLWMKYRNDELVKLANKWIDEHAEK